jgi:hypothetical protein
MHRSISDFVLDMLHNSIEASSSLIILDVSESAETFSFILSDNGCGMDEAELKAVRDPFYSNGTKHKRRRVGLGIPFLAQAAELAGGSFDVASQKDMGTSIESSFPFDHIDTPPRGNLVDTFFAALTYPGEFELVIHRKRSGPGGAEESYCLRRSELMEAAGTFDTVASLRLLRTFLRDQEEALTDKELQRSLVWEK